jgi:L-lactate dehydrogenase complex protein LldG
MNRDAFLERVREAAERGRAYRVKTRDLPDDIGYVGADGDLCATFAAEMVAVGGEAYLVSDLAAAREVVLRLCREVNAQTALCWQHELLDRFGLSESLVEAGIERIDHDSLAAQPVDQRRLSILAADVGITSCEFALAETGSLVMLSRPGRERVASLLPPIHIAVVERSQILPDLYDAIAKLRAMGFEGLPSNAVLITGPSKTGDMELELTTGVHGPGRWCAVVIE